MVAYAREKFYTPQEYLEIERRAETRSEYDRGVIISMAGASLEHNIISANISRHIGIQLENSHCFIVSNDMRVRIPKCDKYYYPDGVVICGEAELEYSGFDTLLNPKLIIEILSESTEKIDRHEKFDCYETLESVSDYVLISQSEPRIEHFSRLSDGAWRLDIARGLEDILNLDSIGCRLSLADIYARITFPTPIVGTLDALANT